MGSNPIQLKMIKRQILALITVLKFLIMTILYNFIIKKLITTKIKITLDLKERAKIKAKICPQSYYSTEFIY